MTSLCVVCPPKFLEWSGVADAEFYQSAWVIGEEFLRNFASARLVIVDVQHVSADGNSDSLSMTSTIEDLAKACEYVAATEVIVPDVLEQSGLTLMRARSFFSYLPPNLQYCSKMFIPQGKSIPDWLDCLRVGIAELGHLFNTIGIPKVLEKHCPRRHLIDYIPVKYDIHLLGTWGGCADFFRSHRVRSWDTSLPFAAAQFARMLSPTHTPPKYKPDLFMGNDPPDIPSLIENIRYIQSLIG